MLAPISWLKDYVDIKISPEALAKKLVSIGFEVEEIIKQEERVSKVVTGRIVSVEKHPNADRLRVTKIDVGAKTIQVVTNVPVEGGETIAVALSGATLADGHKIVKGELRGVLSEGMLCGLEELGLTTDDVDGQAMGDIIRFKDGTALGVNVLKALGYDDVILDVGVTANRPDCNSVYKLAKEVAVALKTTCREPEISYETAGGSVDEYVKVSVENSDLCPRYMAAAVKGVKIFPSSKKIKSRLRAVGIRPINNVVDITNYVLTEIGQPMHAFDRRDLDGGEIIVRNAFKDEEIVTLDGKKNILKPEMLVICDANRPVAVAGVMGGENSGIKDDTSELIFESARFARDSIRRTSRTLNLRSDSSSRFEKGVDFASQEYGLKRALTLIYQTGSGEIVDGIIDRSVPYKKSKEIKFDFKKIENILGCKAPKKQFISTLSRLGVEIIADKKDMIARVPEDREDIEGVNDLAEEFIRVYGYDHIKPTLFEFAPLTKGGKTEIMICVDKLKSELCAAGYSECVTYSFTSPKFADALNLPQNDERRKAVPLLNPLGEAMSVMRTTLTGSMLETLVYNISRFNRAASLFEIAKVYKPEKLPLTELPYEEETLCLGAYGDENDFFTLKAAVERACSAFGIEAEYVRSSEAFLHPGRGADVFAGGERIGYLGEIHPNVSEAYGADLRLYAAELSVNKIFKMRGAAKGFKAFSKFPPVERDLAVVVDERVTASELIAAVKGARIEYLADAKVFDTYSGDQIGAGRKSVAIKFVFSSNDRTLTDEDIRKETDKILKALKKNTGAKLR